MFVKIIILSVIWARLFIPVWAQDGCLPSSLPRDVLEKIVKAADATISLQEKDPCFVNGNSNERPSSQLLLENTAKITEDISELSKDIHSIRDELQSLKELENRPTQLSSDGMERQIKSVSQIQESRKQQIELFSLKMENLFLSQQVWVQNKFENIQKFMEDFVTEFQNLKEMQENSLNTDLLDIYAKIDSIIDLQRESEQKQASLHEKTDNKITSGNSETQNKIDEMLQLHEETERTIRLLLYKVDNEVISKYNETQYKIDGMVKMQKETADSLEQIIDKIENAVIPSNNETQYYIDSIRNVQSQMSTDINRVSIELSNSSETILNLQKVMEKKQHDIHEEMENEIIPYNKEILKKIISILELQQERKDDIRNKEDKNKTEIHDSEAPRARDCSELHRNGSGVYIIYPYGKDEGVRAFCDNEWTVILSRKPQENIVDFNKNWTDYKEGIGDPETEHWIGNEVLHTLTRFKNYKLRVDMEDIFRNKAYALYKIFSVEDEDNGYKLHIGGYWGSAGDSLGFLNGIEFSTPDRGTAVSNCARLNRTGFWFRSCTTPQANPFTSQQTVMHSYLWSPLYSDSLITKIIFKIKPLNLP